MPAPNSTLLDAIRGANAERHIFMRLDHSQGILRYWTGLGAFSFLGETYNGIAGLARVTGVSDSADVQQHQLSVTLNAVPLSALTDVDQSIRGKTADMWAVWIDAAGAVVHSIKVFSGKGNRLIIKPGDDTYELEATLKANLANWLTRGDAFFTNVDQQRRYSGDTGFILVPALQNALITGWQRSASAPPTDLIYYASNFSNAQQRFADASGNIVGLETYGAYFYQSGGAWYALDGAWYLKEEVTNAAVSFTSAGNPLTVGGGNVSFNGGSFGISINGNLIRSTVGNYRLRKQGTIGSISAATTELVPSTVIGGVRYLYRAAGSASSGNYSGLIYPANSAYTVLVSGSTFTVTQSNGSPNTCSDLLFYTNSGAYAGRGVAQGIGYNTSWLVVYNHTLGGLCLGQLSGGRYTMWFARIGASGDIILPVGTPLASATLYRCIPENNDTTAYLRVWT